MPLISPEFNWVIFGMLPKEGKQFMDTLGHFRLNFNAPNFLFYEIASQLISFIKNTNK